METYEAVVTAVQDSYEVLRKEILAMYIKYYFWRGLALFLLGINILLLSVILGYAR